MRSGAASSISSRPAATPKGYAVRPAVQDDFKAIVGIYNWAVNQTFATIDSEPLDAEEARGLGYLTIVASVARDNRAGLALFTKQGFEVVGTIRNAAHKFDRWMDITLVQKELEG